MPLLCLTFDQELIKNTDRNDEDRPELEMALEAMQVRTPPRLSFPFLLRSSIGGEGIAYGTVFNSSATWADAFRLRGYKCMLVIFVFP